MEFRLAIKKDLKEIALLYEMVKGKKYCVWDENYPTINDIEYDFEHNCLYVLKDNDVILGAVSVNFENELGDDSFIWWYTKNVKELVRVVINPNYQNKGLGEIMINQICELLSNEEVFCIHLIVEVNNLPAVRMYEKCGFHHCGDGTMFGHNYYFYEKKIAKTV